MKTTLLSTALIFAGLNLCAQKDYTIIIDGKTHEINLDENNSIKVNGKLVDVIVKQKDILNYTDEFFSFQYPKAFSISKTVIEQGISQVMIMTAEGSGILIQKYENIDPSFLNEMMLKEVTKESLSYGFEMERADYQKKLLSGHEIMINKATLSYKNETNEYEVATLGKKDSGILVMTMTMNLGLSNQGKEIIELMWSSLSFNE